MHRAVRRAVLALAITAFSAREGRAAPGGSVPGDANGDGRVDVADVYFLLNYLFAGGSGPIGPADANGDGTIDVRDAFHLINYLFAGGATSVPDVMPPSVIAFSPRASGSAVNVTATFEMSEPVMLSSVVAGIEMKHISGDGTPGPALAGSVAVSRDGRIIMFHANAPLLYHRPYVMVLTNISDLSGNTLASYRSFFTTGFVVESTPPRVLA